MFTEEDNFLSYVHVRKHGPCFPYVVTTKSNTLGAINRASNCLCGIKCIETEE
jgi:hypothetical protein